VDHPRPGSVAEFDRLELEAMRTRDVIPMICGLQATSFNGALPGDARSGFEAELSVRKLGPALSESGDRISFR
jgi:hypothetical protein